MHLPNAQLAHVDREKICEYLLNAAHPDNGGKARFFLAMGFDSDGWQVLANALRKLAGTGTVVKSMESAHGRKYILDGQIETPRGMRPAVRTIWIVDMGKNAPRLVTAYPQEE